MKHNRRLIHPATLIIVLAITGITCLFLAMVAAYLYERISRGNEPVQVPGLFYFNTLLILSASISLHYAKQRFEDDETVMLKTALWVTLGLTLTFMFLQAEAFRQLAADNIRPDAGNLAAFIYLITGFHFVHLAGGLPFLIKFIYKAYRQCRDHVAELMFFSDPDNQRFLRLLNLYWHYLGGLWVVLLAFFLLNHMV